MIGRALNTFLTGNSPISTAFGSEIYRGYRPQSGSLPYLLFQVVSAPALYDATGLDPWDTARVQLDVVASSAETRDDLVQIVDNEMNGYGGLMDTTQIRSCTRENLTELDEVDGERRRYRTSIDYELWFER